MTIFLIGFMGSGKTSIGKLLAGKMGKQFIDLDKEIEKETQRSIAELFEELGEDKFREIENRVLNKIIQTNECIVATGGGTPCFMDNIDIINRAGTSVYLKTSAGNILSRLRSTISLRPLLKNIAAGQLEEEIKKMIEFRKQYYEKANIIIDTNALNEQETVDMILKKLQ